MTQAQLLIDDCLLHLLARANHRVPAECHRRLKTKGVDERRVLAGIPGLTVTGRA